MNLFIFLWDYVLQFTFLCGIIVVLSCSNASKCIESFRDIPCSFRDSDLTSQGSELFTKKYLPTKEIKGR